MRISSCIALALCCATTCFPALCAHGDDSGPEAARFEEITVVARGDENRLFDIPEELAIRLRPLESQVPRILELGLRELNALSQPGFQGAAEVLEFLASLPSPEEILKLRPSDTLRFRMDELLEKNRTGGLAPEEDQEWSRYEYLEHLVLIAKAHLKLKKC